MKAEVEILVTQICEAEELHKAFEIRREVFVEEQGVPLEAEFDLFDDLANPKAAHVLVYYQGEPGAAGRLRLLEDWAKPERICVRAPLRQYGLGSVLVRSLENLAMEYGFKQTRIHAQVQARSFYEKLGYKQVSEEFMEDGIPHIVMERKLK